MDTKGRVGVLAAACALAVAGPATAKERTASEGKRAKATQNAPDRSAGKVATVPGEIVVRWLSSTRPGTRAAVVKALGGRTLDWFGQFNTSLIDVPALRAREFQLDEFLAAFKRLPMVYAVEPNPVARPKASFNDPMISPEFASVELPAAWDYALGAGVAVAVVDNGGVQRGNAELSDKLLTSYDASDGDSTPIQVSEHATGMAGIIGALGNNNALGVGACPLCAILPISVAKSVSERGNPVSDSYHVAKGIVYAADAGAKIINVSMTTTSTATLESAVQYAWAKGAFLACSAGSNDDGGGTTDLSFPAQYTQCFAVTGASKPAGVIPSLRNAAWVDIGAPHNVAGPSLDAGRSVNWYGTSPAAAVVSGVAGLLSSAGLNNYGIRDRLCSTVDPVPGSMSCGGRVNARKALAGVTGPPGTAPTQVPNGSFESGPKSWSQSSNGGHQLISGARPFRGSFGLWMAEYDNAFDSAQQSIAITASRPYLSIQTYITSKEYGSHPYDTLRIKVLSPSGALLGTLGTLHNGFTRNVWRQSVFSMHHWVGQIVTLQFEARNDGSLPTGFFIDDVDLRDSSLR